MIWWLSQNPLRLHLAKLHLNEVEWSDGSRGQIKWEKEEIKELLAPKYNKTNVEISFSLFGYDVHFFCDSNIPKLNTQKTHLVPTQLFIIIHRYQCNTNCLPEQKTQFLQCKSLSKLVIIFESGFSVLML